MRVLTAAAFAFDDRVVFRRSSRRPMSEANTSAPAVWNTPLPAYLLFTVCVGPIRPAAASGAPS